MNPYKSVGKGDLKEKKISNLKRFAIVKTKRYIPRKNCLQYLFYNEGFSKKDPFLLLLYIKCVCVSGGFKSRNSTCESR